jgi:hypothetical protein
MKKTLLVLLLVCIILTACGSPKSIPFAIPTALLPMTPEPSSTATATFTPAPTLIPSPTEILPTDPPPTPTLTPFPPYHTKGVIFDYYDVGNFSYFDGFFAPGSCCAMTKLILYDDGQMLADDGQKFLSPGEIKKFLAKLEAMGFFSLESNGEDDPTDKLYNFGDNYERIFDGTGSCILVNADKSRQLCVRDYYKQYLIPQMKNILKYLDEYKPAGLTPYYSDRILLSIEPADPDRDDLPKNAIPWDERFPSLDYSPPRKYGDDIPASIMYVEGDMAKEIMIFMENLPNDDLFIQNGKKYIVECISILPHQKVINAYQ